MKIFWVVLGSISLAFGIAGIFLPLLPHTPFLMLTLYCYAKGSDKFHAWFIQTWVYKNYLENYSKKKPLTIKEKLITIISTTIMVLISMYFAPNDWLRLGLSTIIIGHIVYFGFIVKTAPSKTKDVNNKLDKNNF